MPRPVPLSQALKAAAANSSEARAAADGPAPQASTQVAGAAPEKKKRGHYNLSDEEKAARQERLARARATSNENTKRRMEIRAAVRQRMGPLAVDERVELECLKEENEAGLLTTGRRKRLANLLEHFQLAAPAAAAVAPAISPEPAPAQIASEARICTPTAPEPAPARNAYSSGARNLRRRAERPSNTMPDAVAERLAKMELQQNSLAELLRRACSVGQAAVAKQQAQKPTKPEAPAPKTPPPKDEEEDSPPPRIMTFDLAGRGSSLGF